jgi:hypothetical protein
MRSSAEGEILAQELRLGTPPRKNKEMALEFQHPLSNRMRIDSDLLHPISAQIVVRITTPAEWMQILLANTGRIFFIASFCSREMTRMWQNLFP